MVDGFAAGSTGSSSDSVGVVMMKAREASDIIARPGSCIAPGWDKGPRSHR